MQSVFPAYHHNTFMNHVISVGRAIENSRNGVVNSLWHPIDTVTGCNPRLGCPTDVSRLRNQARGRVLSDQWKEFAKGTSAKKLEMVTQLSSDLILGSATGGFVARGAQITTSSILKTTQTQFTALMKAGGLAIDTPFGVAYQRFTPMYFQARRAALEGSFLYRTGKAGRSKTSGGQFWSPEIPVKSDYALRHGIPAANATGIDFLQGGKLKPGQAAIARKAPVAHDGLNPGGAVEIVTPSNAVALSFYNAAPGLPAQIVGTARQFKVSKILDSIITNTPSPMVIGAGSVFC
jgi:hypothetical protein